MKFNLERMRKYAAAKRPTKVVLEIDKRTLDVEHPEAMEKRLANAAKRLKPGEVTVRYEDRVDHLRFVLTSKP